MAEKRLFLEPLVFEPISKHTHTIILLHGRRSTGQEFAEDLFAAELSTKHESLRQRFPTYRWVFPSSRKIWSATFEETMPAWFEATSLTDISARPEFQVPGIEQAVKHIRRILDEEIDRLENNPHNVIVGGISQGAAVGLWVILSEARSLGAFFGASCWLPFERDVLRYLGGERPNEAIRISESDVGLKFAHSTIASRTQSTPHTPIFLGHGIDDAYIDVQLGRAARRALTKAGYSVEWREYQGADEEGHWLKEPEQVDDIAFFLEQATDMQTNYGSCFDRISSE
jgi:predicted esterase